MESIKFYSKNDLTSGMSIKNIIECVNNFSDEIDKCNINDILKYFNIIKFIEIKEFRDIILNETDNKVDDVLKLIKEFIKTFIRENKFSFLSLYKYVDIEYKEDFFEFIDQYNIYKSIESLDFEELLKNSEFHYYIILKYRKIVDRFDEIICKNMIEDVKCAEILIDKYIYDKNLNINEVFLPRSLSQKHKDDILLKYIESEMVNMRYLKLIIEFPSNREFKIGDKIKLRSKRRYEKELYELSKSNTGSRIKTGVEVIYDENQQEAVIYTYNSSITKCSVSTKWIQENLDFNTLLNNFIYIFEFFDTQIRLNLVSKLSEISALENHIALNDSKDLYKKSFEFNRKDMISTSQIYSYIKTLEKYKIRLEDIIEWFFKSYLTQEFGINNYIVEMPTSNSSYFEKCRSILPEIDRILKQYKFYIEDGEIDQELLQISSSHMFFDKCLSINNDKYIYPDSEIFSIASNLLFSDQSRITYIPKLKSKYNRFYKLITEEKIRISDFNEYQIKSIEWLIENKIICEDTDGYLQFVNLKEIIIFLDLYKNSVISYWNCNKELRDEIDNLVNKKVLKFDNKLFTNDEQDYLNYHLNKSKFSNSLDLRNSYLHGTQTNDEEIHRSNYLIFLKLVIIIIVKINDDLCIRQISEQTN